MTDPKKVEASTLSPSDRKHIFDKVYGYLLSNGESGFYYSDENIGDPPLDVENDLYKKDSKELAAHSDSKKYTMYFSALKLAEIEAEIAHYNAVTANNNAELAKIEAEWSVRKIAEAKFYSKAGKDQFPSSLLKRVCNELGPLLFDIVDKEEELTDAKKTEIATIIQTSLCNYIEVCNGLLKNLKLDQFVKPILVATGPINVAPRDIFKVPIAEMDTLDEVRDAFRFYTEIAKSTNIEESIFKNIYTQIFSTTKNFYPKGVPNGVILSNYCSIVGPSLMGKTQFAFSLARHFPVIYVNFASLQSLQSIYQAFQSTSLAFISCLHVDVRILEKNQISLDSHAIGRMPSSIKLNTISLLWNFVKISTEFDSITSGWFEFYLKSRTFYVEAMSPYEFIENLKSLIYRLKGDGKRFTPPIVFTDEINLHSTDTIKLLRNICRILGLPTVLASTNAIVNSLLHEKPFSVLNGDSIWVHVIRTLPQANLKGIIHVLDWDRFSNEKCELNLKSILQALKIEFQPCDFSLLQNLLLIMRQQSKTCLQGVAVHVHTAFKDELLKQSGRQLNVVAIWKHIVTFLHDKLEKRKPAAFRRDGPFHSLAMISNFRVISDKNSRELDNSNRPVPTAEIVFETINKHYYYFGSIDDPIVIPLNNCDGDLEYKDRPYNCSNFNLFKDDMFLCMAIWYHICYNLRNSVASIICRYLVTLSSATKKQNGFRYYSNYQECMVYWALCNSTHKTIHSLMPCPQFVISFIENVQMDPETLRMISPEKGIYEFSLPKLENFLTRIEIPYLLPVELLSSEISSKLDGLCSFGQCTRLTNKSSLIFSFELFFDGAIQNGFVEYQYQDKILSDSIAKESINRAKEQSFPLSMLLASGLNAELKSKNYYVNQQIGKISVYSVFYSSGQMEIVPLAECNDPESVFIIIETNFCIPNM